MCEYVPLISIDVTHHIQQQHAQQHAHQYTIDRICTIETISIITNIYTTNNQYQ